MRLPTKATFSFDFFSNLKYNNSKERGDRSMKMYPLTCPTCSATYAYKKSDIKKNTVSPTETYWSTICPACREVFGEWSFSSLVNHHNAGYLSNKRSVVFTV